jgi:D-alanine-D-alanine ligase
MKRKRILLLFGGRSAEHEVSCISARHVAAAMDSGRYEVIPVGITREGRWMLPDASRKVLEGGSLEIPEVAFEAVGEAVAVVGDPGAAGIVPVDPTGPLEAIRNVDVVFPVLHGPYGEDGTVQGMLELAGIAYVGSGVLGSALGMDKEKMKVAFRGHGLPTGDFYVVRQHEWGRGRKALVKEALSRLGFPVFVKPANLGSSIGITKCHDEPELEAGIDQALLFDRKVMVEESIPGREIECGVLGNDEPQASVPGEVVPANDFYDYQSKYLGEGSRTIIPAGLPTPVTELIQNYAVRAFIAIEAAGMARVDFFYDEGGRGVVLNEINTIPGFTTISMFPKMWEATGIPYPELIDRLIELAVQRHENKKS